MSAQHTCAKNTSSFCGLLKQVQMHFKERGCACVNGVFMCVCPFLCRVYACELFSAPMHTLLYITILFSHTCTLSTLGDVLIKHIESINHFNI